MLGLCDICGKPGAVHGCSICGARVCDSCYHAPGKVCKNCMTGLNGKEARENLGCR